MASRSIFLATPRRRPRSTRCHRSNSPGSFTTILRNPRRQRDAVDALRHGLDHRQLDVIPVFGELSREDQDWIGILEKELTGRSWGELGLVLEQTTSHCEPAHGRGCQSVGHFQTGFWAGFAGTITSPTRRGRTWRHWLRSFGNGGQGRVVAKSPQATERHAT